MRSIFTVNAWIVDSNGTKNILSGYPKDFDSKNYADDDHPLPDGNPDKAQKRAEGDFSDVWGAFCKRDDRMIQTVVMYDVYGAIVDRKSMGNFPEPEPEPTPEPDSDGNNDLTQEDSGNA